MVKVLKQGKVCLNNVNTQRYIWFSTQIFLKDGNKSCKETNRQDLFSHSASTCVHLFYECSDDKLLVRPVLTESRLKPTVTTRVTNVSCSIKSATQIFTSTEENPPWSTSSEHLQNNTFTKSLILNLNLFV